ncbi:hypothetical protein COP2_009799 [Malus domestica]
MALKLDISKAYDCVELKFLEAMMQRLGFSERWIHMVMLCVSTGLLALLTKTELQDELQGIKVCRVAPSIQHLFFADDSFLFARGTISECQSIKQVLRAYELAFGQAVNFEKSCVSFSPNLNDYDKQLLADCLGMR